MPLIIISGGPCSGKTFRARQLEKFLTERISSSDNTSSSTQTPVKDTDKSSATGVGPKYRIHYISDSTLSIPRAVYDLSTRPEHTRSANASEKDARAKLSGAVKRVLSDRDIVIIDSLNYIKGWRYQLHCEAKAVRTPSCVLRVSAGTDRARQINEARLVAQAQATPPMLTKKHAEEAGAEAGAEAEAEADTKEQHRKNTSAGAAHDLDEEPYERENWENLMFRYEEPNPMTRWDSPLFTLIYEDDAAAAHRVFEDIWDAIAGKNRKDVKPNQATIQRSRDAPGDYLFLLDRETQDIVKAILEHVQTHGDEPGGAVKVSGKGLGESCGKRAEDGEELVVELPTMKTVQLPQLQRLRRAFMGLNRGGIGLEGVGTLAPERIRKSFVGYLNDIFEKGE